MVGPEIAVVFIIILLLFGKNLPGTMRAMGMSVNEFKKGLKDAEKDGPTPPAPPASPT